MKSSISSNTDYNELQSKTMNWLRFPLMVAVCFIHVSHKSLIDMHPSIFAHSIYFFITQVVARLAVPLFFIISGYYFFYNKNNHEFIFNKEIYFSKIAKRIKTLVVPYIFWNALVWMIKILPTVIEDPSSLNIFQIFKDFLYYGNGTMPIAFQFWFIRDLMYMIILSPILYLLLRKGKLITLLLLFAIWFFPVIHTKYLPSLAALFFFSFGAFYGINGRNIIKDLAYLPNIPLLLLTITSAIIDLIINEPPTTIVHGAINNVYIHKIFILSGIITLLNFISSMLYNKNINKKLSSASFFLFASHPLILSKIIKSAVNILPHNDFSFLTIYLLSVPLTVIICIGIYNLLKRFLPTFTSVITGGR